MSTSLLTPGWYGIRRPPCSAPAMAISPFHRSLAWASIWTKMPSGNFAWHETQNLSRLAIRRAGACGREPSGQSEYQVGGEPGAVGPFPEGGVYRHSGRDARH